MGEATEQPKVYFRCPACSVELLWNARVAGHKVSCPCGHVFVAPMRAAILAEDGPEPEPERRAPRRDAEMAAMFMRPRKRVVDDEDDEKGGPVRNWIVPGCLMGVGTLILATQVTWTKKEIGGRMDMSFGQMVIIMAALVVTLLAAVGLITYLMNIDFGKIKPAIFKLCAIPVFAGAIAIAVARFDKDPTSIWGLGMAWHLLVLIYWGCFSFLFALELFETILVCFIVAVVQAVTVWMIFTGT
jgi:hypothetical protein